MRLCNYASMPLGWGTMVLPIYYEETEVAIIRRENVDQTAVIVDGSRHQYSVQKLSW